ncbi:MAG: hypothetical protein QOH90_667 [Actinomycetota bacterium]|nr:hypothetical protein [Actinomycetota bacterium]
MFLILYLTKQGYSPAQAGGAVGAYGIGSLAAAAIGGSLTDRLGRKVTIAISMFGSAVMMLLLSQMSGLTEIVITVAFAGLAAELYRPASSALVADLVPDGQRVIAFAAYRLAINAGFAFGPALAGFLATHSFFYLFVGDAVSSAAFGVIALTSLPHGLRTRGKRSAEDEGIGTVFRDRSFMVFCLATLTISFVYFQGETTLALHVKAVGLSAANYGALLSINGLVIVCLELALSGFTQKRRARPVMTVGALLVGAGFMLTIAADSFLPLAATVFVWTIGEIINAPVSQAYVADLAPAKLRGRYLGVWGLSFSVAFIAAPTAGSWIYSRSPNTLWVLCGALSVVAAALIMLGPERKITPVFGVEPGPEIAGVET